MRKFVAVMFSVAVSGRRSTDDGSIAHRWALEGRGIVYKSWLDVSQSLARGELPPLLPEWLGDELPLHAVLPSQRFMPQRLRVLIEHLAAGLAPAAAAYARLAHRR